MAGAASVYGNIPVPEYINSVVEEFPKITKGRAIESSIASRYVTDILPVNLSSNMRITDQYLEFRIEGVRGAFIDLSKLILEIKLSLSKSGDQTKLGDDDHFSFVNGIGNTLFKAVQVYVGDQVCESNPLYSYWSYIKMLTSFSPDSMETLGALTGFRNDATKSGSRISTFTTASFTDASDKEKTFMSNCKEHGLHLTFPLMIDMASSDQYLLDGVNVRIRLEMAKQEWFLNGEANVADVRCNVDFATLHVTRLCPYPSALNSLNKALGAGTGRVTRTVFNKTLSKQLVLARGQTSLTSDLPFGQVIPERLYCIIVPMPAFAGSYNENGLYFGHHNISEVALTMNGSVMYNNSMKFPHECSRVFYQTLEALGLENKTVLSYDVFKEGHTLFVFNLLPEDLRNTLPVEQTGNLRLSITLKEGIDKNMIVMLFGDIKSVLSIDQSRNVQVDSRA